MGSEEHRRTHPVQGATADARPDHTAIACRPAQQAARLLHCPTYRTFTALTVGLLAQPGRRTVTGMLTAARLAGRWHHRRAHRFFSAACWSAAQLGLTVLEPIVTRLVDPLAPLLATDDSLFKRRGRRVDGTCFHSDPTASGRGRTAWGNNWVILSVPRDDGCLGGSLSASLRIYGEVALGNGLTHQVP